MKAQYTEPYPEYHPSLTALTLPGFEKEYEENFVPELEGIEVRPLKEPESIKEKLATYSKIRAKASQ